MEIPTLNESSIVGAINWNAHESSNRPYKELVQKYLTVKLISRVKDVPQVIRAFSTHVDAQAMGVLCAHTSISIHGEHEYKMACYKSSMIEVFRMADALGVGCPVGHMLHRVVEAQGNYEILLGLEPFQGLAVNMNGELIAVELSDTALDQCLYEMEAEHEVGRSGVVTLTKGVFLSGLEYSDGLTGIGNGYPNRGVLVGIKAMSATTMTPAEVLWVKAPRGI